jgi:hypothetical protein
MRWTRRSLTETSGWFNQKPLAPLDETLRLPLALKELFRLAKKEYGITLKEKPLIVHNGYIYLQSYKDYLLQLAFQPATYLLLWRLLRETEKTKKEFEQDVNKFLKELNQFKKQDLSKLNNQELLNHVKNSIKFDAYWIFRFGGGLHIVYHHFSEVFLKLLYRLLVKDKSSQNYHELLIGYPNKLKEADLAFWQVVKGSLSLDDYIKDCGYRATDISLAIPTIGEDKEVLQERVKAFQNTPLPDFEKIEKNIKQRKKSREKYISDNFRSWIPFGKAIFNKVLKIARDYIPIRETRRFYYTMGSFLVRKSSLELGERLEILKRPEDIFFLTKDELEKAVLKSKKLNQRQIILKISQRRREWQKQTEQPPPEEIKL